MANTGLNRSQVLVLTNKSGGDLTQGAVVVVSTGTANAFTTTTSAAYSTTLVGVIIEPNGIANNASGLVSFGGYVPKINLDGSASLGHFVKCTTVAGQGTPHATLAAGDFAEVLGTGTTPAAVLFGVKNASAGAGDVVGPGSATDGNLAVFDGTTGKLIKDGGAVPAGGVSFGQVLSYPTTFTGDTISGSSATPFADVSAFSTKEVLNSRILHLQTLGASKDHRVRVTLGTTKATTFDVTTCVSFNGLYWSGAFDTYLEVRLSDASDNQIAIARIGVSYFAASQGDYRKDLSMRVGGSSISAADANSEFSAPMANPYTVRFTRDGSNVIRFYVGTSNIPMSLGQVLINSNDTPFTATVAGTLARVEYSIHTPSGPGGTAQWDAYVDYLMSI